MNAEQGILVSDATHPEIVACLKSVVPEFQPEQNGLVNGADSSTCAPAV